MAVAIMAAPVDHPPSYISSTGSSSSRRDSYISNAGSSRSHPSPRYSPTAGRTELVIDTQTLADSTNVPSQEYIYRCKNLELNLGPKIWGTSVPSFGSNGIVEGRASLLGDLKSVSSVSLKLEGKVITTFTERGLVSGAATTEIASVVTTLLPSPSGGWDASMPFSIPFPAYALGRQSRIPPSLTTYQPGVTSEIKYALKATVVRKGLRRNDSLKIPLFYFPRSFARGPSLQSVPEPLVNIAALSVGSSTPDHVRVLELEPTWKKDTPCHAKKRYPAVFLTLPSVLSFASDETIPLALSIISPHAPAISKLLSAPESVRIQLVKRTRLWVNNGKSGSKFDSPIGNADIQRVDDSQEGHTTLFFDLVSALSTTLASWRVTDVAEQQYFIRVNIAPPPTVAAHVPSFVFEQDIEFCTDAFDSSEHEIISLGGTPSPAAGLLPQPTNAFSLGRQLSNGSSVPSTFAAIR